MLVSRISITEKQRRPRLCEECDNGSSFGIRPVPDPLQTFVEPMHPQPTQVYLD